MITTNMANAAAIKATNLELGAIQEAVEGVGPFGEEGEGEGDPNSGKTLIATFIPFSQCLPTPQMYHFLPVVVRGITSFPEVKGVISLLGVQLLKAA